MREHKAYVKEMLEDALSRWEYSTEGMPMMVQRAVEHHVLELKKVLDDYYEKQSRTTERRKGDRRA